MTVIKELKICAPNPDSCEDLIKSQLPGVHVYDYTCNGQTTEVTRDIKNVSVYQEGEGPYQYAISEGSLVEEQGDVVAVAEFNHGTFNWSIVADGVLQSSLTHIVPRGGLTALATMIKLDETFPDSIRDVDEDLIVNAIAFGKPNQPYTYKGMSFQEAFDRSVVRWIRNSFSEAKTQWKKVRGRDWVNSINKILCSGGAAPLAQHWKNQIMAEVKVRREISTPQSIEEADKMEQMANQIIQCPNPRNSNALGMLQIDPVEGFCLSVDFGYSAVKTANSNDVVSLTTSAIAIPFARIRSRDIREKSALIELKSGPLFDYLKRTGQPTSYIFGAAANSIMGAEKIISNAKEPYIPHAVLAVCAPQEMMPAESKKSRNTNITVSA